MGLAAATEASATHADPDARTASAAGAAGFVVAPNADGVAIRTVRGGYRPGTGALYASVTLNQKLPPDVQVQVRFGHRAPGTGGCAGNAATVTFTGGSGAARGAAAAWTGDAASIAPFHEIEDLISLPTAEMAAALRADTLSGQQIDCAQAAVAGVTQQPVDVPLNPAASVPSVASSEHPAMQLNYRYGGRIAFRNGHAAVSVTCVTARTHQCVGFLTIRQQHTHRLLGEASVHVRLGDTASIPVALHLPAELKRVKRIPLTATLQTLHGQSIYTALAVTR